MAKIRSNESVEKQIQRAVNEAANKKQAEKNALKNRPKTDRKVEYKEKKLADDTRDVLRFIPLGGLGEIGKNLTVYEYNDDIIVVDAGFAFPDNDQLGIDYTIPEVTYLEENKHKIRALLITHAHEDHVGGIPYIWPKLGVPIYGSQWSCGFIEKKLEEFELPSKPEFRMVDLDKNEKIQLGAFTVEFFRVNHAVPDPAGVAITTPVGTVIHTGDFKFDHTPVDGKKTDFSRLSEYGAEGVLALMSDSTNCEVPGYTMSEKDIEGHMSRIFEKSGGRLIISSFASQINRIQQVINLCEKYNRKLAFSGRSILKNVSLAVQLGYLRVTKDTITRIEDTLKMKDNEVVILSTGSQGEAMSALSRMASGDHKQIKIKKGDTIILSSSPIPGNEKAINETVDNLFREGATVYREGARGMDEGARLHVSGHAGQEELKLMMDLTKPKYFVPIHGEVHHLIHHADIARELDIPDENIFVSENGQPVEFGRDFGRFANKKVPAGIVLVDGIGVGDVQNIVLRDRQAMANEGIFMIIMTVDKRTGKLVTSPDIISRGFIYMKESEELVNKTRGQIKSIFAKNSTPEAAHSNWLYLKTKIRDDVSHYLYNQTKRRPMVIPVIIEV